MHQKHPPANVARASVGPTFSRAGARPAWGSAAALAVTEKSRVVRSSPEAHLVSQLDTFPSLTSGRDPRAGGPPRGGATAAMLSAGRADVYRRPHAILPRATVLPSRRDDYSQPRARAHPLGRGRRGAPGIPLGRGDHARARARGAQCAVEGPQAGNVRTLET